MKSNATRSSEIWRKLTLFGGALATSTCLAATAGAQTVVMATDQVGTLLNAIGSGVAKVVSDAGKGRVVVRTFAGQDVYVGAIARGEIDVAPLSAYGTWLQYNGRNVSKTKYQNMRLLFSSRGGLLQAFVTTQKTDIKQIADLKGKRLASGFGATPLLQNSTDAALMTAGLTMKDVTPVPVSSIADAIRSLGSGHVDATWTAFGAPALREVNAQVGLRYLSMPMNPDAIAMMRKEQFPGLRIVPMKANPQAALPNDANMVAYDIYIVARKDVDDAKARMIVEGMWNNIEKLQKAHVILRNFTHKSAVTDLPVIPYHPAAVAFYKEKGAWDAEAEKAQERLSK